jgi:hypothetical protein
LLTEWFSNRLDLLIAEEAKATGKSRIFLRLALAAKVEIVEMAVFS